MFSLNLKEHRWAIVYCGISTFGALCYGYDQIYYTGVLGMRPFIDAYGTTKDEDGATALTTSFLSLTASIIYVGELLGALVAAYINDRFGRKGVFYCASACIIAGAIVQAADKSSEGLIIFGRILIGLGIGQFTVTCLLYIGEVAPKGIRGPALMMFQFMQSCSQLVGSGITKGTESIPSQASYKIPMALLALLPLMMIVCLPFMPESPMWLMRKERKDQASISLVKINRSRTRYSPDADVHAMQVAVEIERANAAESSWLSLLRDPIERRKLLFSCGAMVAQQINGIQFFYSYGVVFAQSIGMDQPFTISLITNVLQVVSVFASVLLGNRVPRRSNLLVTTGMMLVAFIVIGGFGTVHPLTNGFATAIVVFSYVIICAFNFGWGPLAFTIASEMATGRNRNKIMSCSIMSFFFTVWIIAFTSPYIYYDAHLGPMLGFIYAGSTLVFSLTYTWYCVGETVGRSAVEIEQFFQHQVPVRKWRGHVFGEDDYARNAESEKKGEVTTLEYLS
ncbi:Hexose transporter 2 [Pseudocercospora fuligena]|uniref:Hexose transporter 2 n=1 Tax=Pseudocercospora fuligena TaxID=685502 RepID=A0A8H6RN70_9PEZI|nr:Hexose transporter 2 [Pseudocercospora fuligena]